MKYTKKYIALGVMMAMVLSAGHVWASGQPEKHEAVTLKGYDGKDLTIESQEPYSPKQTCGECHEYDQISNGYHFQQGRTNADGTIVMSDTYDKKRPWIKSDGMYGKW